MRSSYGSLLFAWLVACSDSAPKIPTSSVPSPAPALVKAAPADLPLSTSIGATSHTRVVIVGGGLAGLVTAYELEKRGVEAHVLEASDAFGGRVGTVDYGNGLHAEYGLQELWEGNPLIGIARELGLGLESGEEAFSSVLIDGKVQPFVQATSSDYFNALFTPAERQAFDQFMTRAKALHGQARSEGLAAPAVQRLQGMTFQAWLASEQLPEKVQTFLRLTLECEVATDWQLFSALFGLLELEIFLDGGVPNHHVRGGNLKLVQALTHAIKGKKTLGATVTGITRGNGKLEVTFMKDHALTTVSADRVVLAVPFVRLPQIQIEPPLSDAHWQAVQTLSLGQYVVVHLLIDRAQLARMSVGGESPFPILTNGPLGVIYGVNEPGPASQPLEVFTLLIYGMQARAFHMQPRDAKVREVLGELDALWPGFAASVKSTHVYSYHPAAVPVWPPGRSPLDASSELLRGSTDGIYFAGDYTWNAHSDGAARSGIRVAEAIGKELGSAPP